MNVDKYNTNNSFNLAEFNGSRIFITGGTGFIGKNILKYIIDNEIKPKKVIILTRDSRRFIARYPELCKPWLSFQEGDISKFSNDGSEYDYFLHAAAGVIERPESIRLFDDILAGTRQALKFAMASKIKVFINFSSGAVYQANQQEQLLQEGSLLLTDLHNTKHTYALAKISAEHLCYLYSQQYQIKIITLRCFCFAGPYLNPDHFAIGEFVQKALRNEDIIVRAGKGIYRSYLFTQDLVRQIFSILSYADSMPVNYEVFNIGSSSAISLPDLAVLVVKLLGSRSQVDQPNLANPEINFYVPNTGKAERVLSTSILSLDEAIIKLAYYYLS